MTLNDIAALFPHGLVSTESGEVVVYTGLLYTGDDDTELEAMA